MKTMQKFLLSLLAACAFSPAFAQTFKVQNLQVLGTVSLASALPGAQGGTGITSIPQYNVAVGGASNTFGFVAPGASGTLFSSTGTSSAPAFQTLATLGVASSAGVTNGSCASAGNVGECAFPSATSIALTNSTPANCTSVSLTAGDWMVAGNISFTPGTSTAFTLLFASLSTTSNTLDLGTGNYVQQAYAGTTNFGQAINAPLRFFTITSTTTIYLVGEAGFSAGSPTMSCKISAVRFH